MIGKELHLENVQLVNGLQTTEAIFKYLSDNPSERDNRCVLVKVLVTGSKALADRIILATNNQTKVDAASLRATDKIQRDIEDLLATQGWFYDRRKNYYANHGKPQNRIVSMSYISWAVLSVRLREPYKCNRARPRYMQVDAAYSRIFDEKADINIFLAVLDVCKGVESTMIDLGLTCAPYTTRNYVTLYRFLYAMLYVACVSRKTHCSDDEIIQIGRSSIDRSVMCEVHRVVIEARQELRDRRPFPRKLHRSEVFQNAVVRRVLRMNGANA